MNWIRINTTLPHSQKIILLAAELGCKRRHALGLAVEFFCWVDNNFSSGYTQLTPKQVNSFFEQKRFAEALCKIGWASVDETGCLFIQNFDTYNGESAKRRAQEAEKKRKQRKNVPQKAGQMSPENGDACPENVPENKGPEKRREDNIVNIASNESILTDPQKESKAPQSEDAVLTYLASLPNCGLAGDELLACASAFFNQAESVGWTHHGQPIRDWRAAARAFLARWQNNNASRHAPRPATARITYRSQTQQNYEL
jgi:hypothetical protein